MESNTNLTMPGKALRVILALVLVLGLSNLASARAAYADTATLTISADYLNFTQTNADTHNTFRDNIMYINGQIVMCTNIRSVAVDGASYSSQALDSGRALMFGLYDKYLWENYGWDAATHYGYLQFMIWLETNTDYVYANVTPHPSDFWSVYEGAKAYYNANKDSYTASGTEWISPTGSQSVCFVPSVSRAKGKLQLVKSDGNSSISADNSCYSLAGAVYTVYSDAACTAAVATLTTDAEGKTGTVELDTGTYYVKETGAAQGYSLDAEALAGTCHAVTVSKDQTSTVSSTDLPQNDPLALFLGKLDKETGKASPLGAGTLADAQFTVSYYDGQYGSEQDAKASGDATRTWVFKTNANGNCYMATEYKVSGDDFYTDSYGRNTFPLGTYLIQETKAPVGYVLDDEVHVVHVTSDGYDEDVDTLNETTVYDQAIRGDLSFSKKDENSSKGMAGIPFLIVSQTTGEAHVVVTDEQGQFSSEASYQSHRIATNANDAAVTGLASAISKGADGKYAADISKIAKVDEASLTDEAGTWFYGTTSSDRGAPSDDLAALPYDTYSIYELPVSANSGMQLVTDTFVVKRNAYAIDLGTIDDVHPTIASTATDSVDGDKYVAMDQDSVVNDRVDYSEVVKGAQYTMRASLVDASGNVLSANEMKFTASDESGYVVVPLSIDTTALSGQSLTAFEELVDANGRVLVSETDLADAAQTVTVVPPTVQTTAADVVSGDQTATTAHSMSVIDHVAYTNLVPGKEYTVSGTLHKRVLDEAGKCIGEEALVDASGNAVTASTVFTAPAASGIVDVTFSFDGYDLADGDAIVAFESISRKGVELAVHADINDDNQSVTVEKPAIGTLLLEANADTDHFVSVHEATVLTDEMAYENLIVGHDYQAASVLFDLTTGLPVLTGDFASDMTSDELQEFADGLYEALGLESSAPKVTFAEGDDGTVTMTTDFDPETVLTSDDADFPAISDLMASNPKIADHLVYAVSSLDIQTEDGTASIDLPVFDSSELGGHDTVCFEVVYDVDDNDEAAVEVDSSDENQSVTFVQPALGTAAFNADDMTKQALAGQDVNIVDKVTYKNLGYTADGSHVQYVMKGTLYDKDTGLPLLVNDKEVTAEMTFTPNDVSSGTVEMTFPAFDATNINGHTVVVFEQLYDSSDLETPVAVHEDIDSVEQSVGIGHNPISGSYYDKTGSNVLPIVAIAAVLAAGACIAVCYGMRRRRAAEAGEAGTATEE